MRFDMHRIGQTISRLRKERNMTQMQLADEMNVSFQAVSNWERGQSMPDISKLPELSELFSVTIDELLGCESPLVEKAVEGKLEEYIAQTPVTVEEAAEVAPILQPAQMEHIADRLMALDGNPQDALMPDMTELLPFLSTEKVDLLFHKQLSTGHSIVHFLPFVSDKAVEAAAVELEARQEAITIFAPFLRESMINSIAQKRMKENRPFTDLLPFMSAEVLDQLAQERTARGESIAMFAPFLSSDTLDEIALTRLRQHHSISDILPFISQRLLNRLADTVDTE